LVIVDGHLASTARDREIHNPASYTYSKPPKASRRSEEHSRTVPTGVAAPARGG